MDLANLQRAIERIVDNRLKTAYDEGKFDNLPGRGEPLRDIDEPFDEFWWLRRWFKRENLKNAQLAKKNTGHTGKTHRH